MCMVGPLMPMGILWWVGGPDGHVGLGEAEPGRQGQQVLTVTLYPPSSQKLRSSGCLLSPWYCRVSRTGSPTPELTCYVGIWLDG